MYVAGHIPIAKHFFYKKFQNEDGTIKSPEEVRKVVADNGLDASKEIVCSCGSGISGSYAFTALKHAGITNISLYDGSWSEYVISLIVSN